MSQFRYDFALDFDFAFDLAECRWNARLTFFHYAEMRIGQGDEVRAGDGDGVLRIRPGG